MQEVEVALMSEADLNDLSFSNLTLLSQTAKSSTGTIDLLSQEILDAPTDHAPMLPSNASWDKMNFERVDLASPISQNVEADRQSDYEKKHIEKDDGLNEDSSKRIYNYPSLGKKELDNLDKIIDQAPPEVKNTNVTDDFGDLL